MNFDLKVINSKHHFFDWCDRVLYWLLDHALTGSDNEVIYNTSVKSLVQSAMEGYNGTEEGGVRLEEMRAVEKKQMFRRRWMTEYPSPSLANGFSSFRHGICIWPDIVRKDICNEITLLLDPWGPSMYLNSCTDTHPISSLSLYFLRPW